MKRIPVSFCRSSFRILLGMGLSMALNFPSARAEVKLPRILSDHMVLQKAEKVPLWGTADPGEKVAVSLDKIRAETVADADGKWRVDLNLAQCGEGPFQLNIQGTNRLEIQDVLVGEVWLCAGQSNMEFPLKSAQGGKEEIAQSANAKMRRFLVKKKASLKPLEDCQGEWVLTSPENIGDFSAVGYFFGKNLQKNLRTPLGLIQSSWGGTPVEAWTEYGALSRNADLKSGADRSREELKSSRAAKEAFTKAYRAWEKKYALQDRETPHPEEYTVRDVLPEVWKTVVLPGAFADVEFTKPGAIWIRKTLSIPPADQGRELQLELTLQGFESIYWNGERIGGEDAENFSGKGAAHSYKIPADKVKPSGNILAIRSFSATGGIRMTAASEKSSPFRLGSLPLAGEWLANREFVLPTPTAEAISSIPPLPKAPPRLQDTAAVLFNGMIHPLVPYGIRGVVWYQGEANKNRAWQYRTSFPLMIENWRAVWGQGDFPFYFCQLANSEKKSGQPGESSWAELREAQAMALSFPATGQAVLIDLGEAGTIHSRNKEDAANRLATLALARTYGEKISFTGPVYESMAVEGSSIRLKFKPTEGGLAAGPLPKEYVVLSEPLTTEPLVPNSPHSSLEGFAICGKDRRWFWADDARIDGESILVASASVPHPVAVRYGWADNPTCNLYNGAGFPASPFRTDDFPGKTAEAKY